MERQDLKWTYNVLNQALKLRAFTGFVQHRAILERVKIAR